MSKAVSFHDGEAQSQNSSLKIPSPLQHQHQQAASSRSQYRPRYESPKKLPNNNIPQASMQSLQKICTPNNSESYIGKEYSQNITFGSSRPAYVEFRSVKDHTFISMIPMSYAIMGDLQDQHALGWKKNKLHRQSQERVLISIQNKLKNQKFQKDKDGKKRTLLCHNITEKQLEETPINQYLNYDLSQEINDGIKNAQILAEEIKVIREQKRMERNVGINTLNGKFPQNKSAGALGNKNIRIKVIQGHNKNHRGLYYSSNRPLKV